MNTAHRYSLEKGNKKHICQATACGKKTFVRYVMPRRKLLIFVSLTCLFFARQVRNFQRRGFRTPEADDSKEFSCKD